MKTNFFLRNLTLFLIPILIPLIIVGSISYVLSQNYIKEEINKYNIRQLQQARLSLELIFSELDSLSIYFNNSHIMFSLNEIFREQSVTYHNSKILETIKSYIDSPSYARPYIHSIYVYHKNYNKQFLASGEGIVEKDTFYDTEWLDAFENQQNVQDVWTQSRSINRYTFDHPIHITTFYKNLYSSVSRNLQGIIVLNINTDYIIEQIKNFSSYEDHIMLILDNNNNLVFNHSTMDESLISEIIDHVPVLSSDQNIFSFNYNKHPYIGAQLPSNSYDWRFISIVPRDVYKISNQVNTYILIFIFLSFALSLLITFILTKRNHNSIKNILSLFNDKESNLSLPHIEVSEKQDEYQYITQNVIKNFIEKNSLKLELLEKSNQTKEAELLALQSQINPHFLYNTLETINWKTLALTGKPNAANNMLENLSSLLQYSLEASTKTILISEEIDATANYIDIQKVRYRDKFEVYWQYNKDVVEKYTIVKLVIQPLVENAISHGLAELEGRKGGIKIKVSLIGFNIKIVVIDNGIGMDKEKLRELHRRLSSKILTSQNIGLINMNKRLQIIYGDNLHLKIKSKKNLGTSITITIPAQPFKDNE